MTWRQLSHLVNHCKSPGVSLSESERRRRNQVEQSAYVHRPLDSSIDTRVSYLRAVANRRAFGIVDCLFRPLPRLHFAHLP
jgi:hypothetical protein